MKNFTLLLIILFSTILATCWEKIDENAVDKGGSDTTINVDGDVTDSTININSDSEDGDSANGTSSSGDTSLDVPVSVEGEEEEVDHEYVLKMIDFGTSPEIELDSNGNAIISYLGTDSSVKVGKATSTVVDGKVNLDISVAIVDSSGIAGSPSLVVDSNNKWGVAYTQSGGTEIKYSTSDSFDNIESYIIGSGLNPNYIGTGGINARLDNNNIPAIGYSYESSTEESYVKFATFQDSKFNIQTTDIIACDGDFTSELFEFVYNSSNYRGILLSRAPVYPFTYIYCDYCFFIENAVGFSQVNCKSKYSGPGIYRITYSDPYYYLLYKYGSNYTGETSSKIVYLKNNGIISDDDEPSDIISSINSDDVLYAPSDIDIHDSKPIVIGADASLSVGLQLARLISEDYWLFTTFNELNSSQINSIDFAITKDGKVKIVFEVNSESADNKIGYIEYKL